MDQIDFSAGPFLPEVEANVDCESVVTVDVGETNTRASFFCVVEGKFRFISSAVSPTTIYAPYNHPGYGVRMALEQLECAIGRSIIGEDGRVLFPSCDHDQGIDGFSVIFSAGPALRVVAAGLQPDVSLESVRRLVDSTYGEIVGTIHLGDGLTLAQRGELIMRLAPDMIVIAGGYEGGARKSLRALLKPVDLVCSRLPKGDQPVVVYAGNQAVKPDVTRALPNAGKLHVLTNIRPSREREQLSPARAVLSDILRNDRLKRFPGFTTLDGCSYGGIIPFTTAFARTMRFLSLDDPSRAVLGVDLGTRKAVSVVAYQGETSIHVVTAPDGGAPELVDEQTLREVMCWLNTPSSEDEVRDYLCNRMLFTGSLPVTFRDLAIEQALARCTLRKIAALISRDLSRLSGRNGDDADSTAFSLYDIEPIVASGSVLTHAASISQAALTILDGLQPCGITSIILDQNHLMGAIGAAMKISPALAIQVMDSNAFINLGLVIAPSFRVGKGEPVLRLRMLADNGNDLRIEVNQGELRSVPLGCDQQAQIWLKPLNGADIGMGPGNGCRLGRISGGSLGMILDCRGRPLGLTSDPDKRRERYRVWLRALRG